VYKNRLLQNPRGQHEIVAFARQQIAVLDDVTQSDIWKRVFLARCRPFTLCIEIEFLPAASHRPEFIAHCSVRHLETN
jgi:hypothetical protein